MITDTKRESLKRESLVELTPGAADEVAAVAKTSARSRVVTPAKD